MFDDGQVKFERPSKILQRRLWQLPAFMFVPWCIYSRCLEVDAACKSSVVFMHCS